VWISYGLYISGIYRHGTIWNFAVGPLSSASRTRWSCTQPPPRLAASAPNALSGRQTAFSNADQNPCLEEARNAGIQRKGDTEVEKLVEPQRIWAYNAHSSLIVALFCFTRFLFAPPKMARIARPSTGTQLMQHRTPLELPPTPDGNAFRKMRETGGNRRESERHSEGDRAPP
jgi:hypothetical protein